MITQKDRILDIVARNLPLRTEQVERLALQCGISGGSAGRYLRWLAAEGKVIGFKESGNKTKTWTVKQEQLKMF